ncbi:MAG: imidazoleglycerol-phosphate dehydratase HisB [Thermodesulfobacteriota bacterium]
MSAKAQRKGKVKRKTTETDIALELNLDGTGKHDVKTGIPFFDHMLALFARHGLFDLKVRAKGDIEVDFHHTVEDVGLSLGEALKKALKTKAGIKRYGRADVPMMDALATVVLDLGGRPNLVYTVAKKSSGVSRRGRKDEFGMDLAEEFMKAFSNNAGADLHVMLHYGKDLHHSVEAVYKALGRALAEAVAKDKRIKGAMSTKGKF